MSDNEEMSAIVTRVDQALEHMRVQVARLTHAVYQLEQRMQQAEVELGIVCESCGEPLTDAQEDHLLHLCAKCRGAV